MWALDVAHVHVHICVHGSQLSRPVELGSLLLLVEPKPEAQPSLIPMWPGSQAPGNKRVAIAEAVPALAEIILNDQKYFQLNSWNNIC